MNLPAVKIFIRLLGLGLLLGQPWLLSAQETAAPSPPCRDVLHLHKGSVLRGQIVATQNEGKTLLFRTWGGAEMEIARQEVLYIRQRCHDGRAPRSYTFREHGWYHHTRLGGLIGQTYYDGVRTGFQLQHSSGWMFSRFVGVGLGTGVEFFDGRGNEPAVYPVFAEVRGYLLPQRITPFYALAAGWGFSGKKGTSTWGETETWKGGWAAQATIGYRIGNYFTIQTGLRLQHRAREWSSPWWNPDTNTDRLLYKRIMLGVGILL